MKKISFLILLFVGYMVHTHAQVGINTTNPFATLDVTKEPSGTVADGIIAPNLSLTELIARNALYGANQSGSFVYITAIDATPAGKTRNVTTVGYYYFDGSEWKHFNDKLQNADNGLSLGTTANVQLGGDLVKNTTIDTKTNTLTITNTGGTDTGLKLPAGASFGSVLTSDASGNTTWNAPGFSVFEVVPYYTETIPFSNVTSLYDMSTFVIDFTPYGYGTYSITLGINISFSSLSMPVNYCIVQLIPDNNKALWHSSTLRFPGAYEAYALKDRFLEDTGSYRIYFSQNITLNATTGTKAYLVYSMGFTSPVSGSVELHIGQNLSGTGAQPQISGGSYVKIN